MDALQAIKGRKSYRSTFKTEPIPREDLREIVEAGFLAPSGCNLQTTKFIAVDDPELVKKLAEIYGLLKRGPGLTDMGAEPVAAGTASGRAMSLR